MKKVIVGLILVLVAAGAFLVAQNNQPTIVSPYVGEVAVKKDKPLAKYTFKALQEREFAGSEITFTKVLKDDPNFTSYLFYFGSDGKQVSGLANIPKEPGTYPVIIMLRGYIDQEMFTTGMGTKNSAEALARQGFITLAPDFLGYGESDQPSPRPIEERFQTYTTALNLLASIEKLPQALKRMEPAGVNADPSKVGIWGHSNGGQIALSVLAITGRPYPTVLWAPVSKPFPYSILYYTDEFEDRGKALRKVLADFEKDYDVEEYNPINFLNWIKAPIQLHQGGADEAVPQKWSAELYQELNRLDLQVAYFTYPGDDHNFSKGSWPVVISRTASFFQFHLS